MLVKPRTNISLTSLAVTFFLGFLVLLLTLSATGSQLAEWLLIASLGIYLLAVISSALALSRGLLGLFLAAIAAFLILHVSYTTGLVTGMLVNLRRMLHNR